MTRVMMSTPKNRVVPPPGRRKGTVGNRSAAVRGRPEPVLSFAQMAQGCFHHDHRAVDDESEIDRPEAHRVPGISEANHADHRKQH